MLAQLCTVRRGTALGLKATTPGNSPEAPLSSSREKSEEGRIAELGVTWEQKSRGGGGKRLSFRSWEKRRSRQVRENSEGKR